MVSFWLNLFLNDFSLLFLSPEFCSCFFLEAIAIQTLSTHRAAPLTSAPLEANSSTMLTAPAPAQASMAPGVKVPWPFFGGSPFHPNRETNQNQHKQRQGGVFRV